MEKHYDSNELMNVLKERIAQMVVGSKFQNNHAFETVLGEILPDFTKSYGQISFLEEEKGIISLLWSEIDENRIADRLIKNNLTLEKVGNDNIRIVSFVEGEPRKNGESICFGKVADCYTINGFDTSIEVTHSHSAINPSLEDYNKCNGYYAAEAVRYDNNGIIFGRQVQSGENTVNNNFKNCDYKSMLFNPDRVIASRFNDNLIPYTTKVDQKRINIDTALVTLEDKNSNQKYESCLPIEHGLGYSLKNMIVGFGGILPDSVSIYPKGKEEINKMIQEEQDPIVREGLQNWIKDREHYTYYSNDCWSNISSRGLK